MLRAILVNTIPADNNVNTIHIYMLTILDFKSRVHIHITHRWVMSSVQNGVNPLIARRKQDLLDWTSERVLNWHFWLSWLVGVTTPKLSSRIYIVKKLMDVTPRHLPFLSIFLLVRGAVTLYAKESLVDALRFSLRRLYMLPKKGDDEAWQRWTEACTRHNLVVHSMYLATFAFTTGKVYFSCWRDPYRHHCRPI